MGIRKFTWPRKTFLFQIDDYDVVTCHSSEPCSFYLLPSFWLLSLVDFLHVGIEIEHGDDALLPRTTVCALGIGVPVRLVVLPTVDTYVSFHY